MLHLQESFSPAMLISPVIVSPVSVQPQVSASSRSDKVVEQLSSRLASIENEIAYAKLEVQFNYTAAALIINIVVLIIPIIIVIIRLTLIRETSCSANRIHSIIQTPIIPFGLKSKASWECWRISKKYSRKQRENQLN
jgi:hypothetical protein